MNSLATPNNGVNLIDWEAKFLEYIDVADRTVETYETGIRQFLLFMESRDTKSPTRDDIIAFRDELKDRLTVSTVNSYLTSIRAFFKFLRYNGVYADITENVKSLKDNDLHKRDALSSEQCKEIIGETESLRDKMIFTLILTCGLRVNETVNIRLEDFEVDNEGICMLKVLGKGRDYKQDKVRISDNVLAMLKEYIKEYNITDYLFVSTSNNNKGGKLSPCSIRRTINKLYEKANIKTDKIVAHSLRHTFATLSIENGEDLREVSKAMRHKSVTVTERYLHDLEEKNNKCSSIVSNLVLGE